MVRIIATGTFHDAEADVIRRVGDRFDCTEGRARHLVALRLAAVAMEQPKAAKKAASKPKKTE